MDTDRLPVFDILSRMPVKSLARSRCVSKLWCEYIGDPYLRTIHGERVVEEPIPIMLHKNPPEGPPSALCFHIVESSKPDNNTDYVLKHLDLEFVPNKPPPKDTVIIVKLRGFCNGLLIIVQHDGQLVTTMNVIHPLRKECYQLPAFPLELSCNLSRESCGLGFDAATNTLKMVYTLLREPVLSNNPDLVHKNLCTMVHVFGQSSWQEIPQVPLYPVEGEAVFSHGCLHWLPSSVDRLTHEVICFDVTKEEFGLINPPKRSGERNILDKLVDVNGEVGLVCHTSNVTMEVWVLKKKQWVLHCKLDKKPPLPSDFSVSVLGSWNKDGDILIKGTLRGGREGLFVYTLKSGGVHKLDIVGWEGNWEAPANIVMYPSNLFSIRGINNTDPLSIQSKTDLKKSCCF